MGRQVQVVAEGIEEGLGTQLGEHALDVQVVGAAPFDLSTMVCQPGHECASVERAAQSFVVQVQDARVAAVAAQSVKCASTGRGHYSATHRSRLVRARARKMKADAWVWGFLYLSKLPLANTYWLILEGNSGHHDLQRAPYHPHNQVQVPSHGPQGPVQPCFLLTSEASSVTSPVTLPCSHAELLVEPQNNGHFFFVLGLCQLKPFTDLPSSSVLRF